MRLAVGGEPIAMKRRVVEQVNKVKILPVLACIKRPYNFYSSVTSLIEKMLTQSISHNILDFCPTVLRAITAHQPPPLPTFERNFLNSMIIFCAPISIILVFT
jgi:hypothetical protein